MQLLPKVLVDFSDICQGGFEARLLQESDMLSVFWIEMFLKGLVHVLIIDGMHREHFLEDF